MEFIKMITYALMVMQVFAVFALAKSITTNGGESKDSDSSALEILYRKARQSRCIRCYDDRYSDDDRQYSYGRNNYGSNSYGTGSGYGSGYGSRATSGYDDRNWYQFQDRYDSRPKYDDRYPERYGSRYDDRYTPRNYDRYDNRGYNDRHDWRATPDYRGTGYESQDKYYDRYNEGYNRDRYDRNRSGNEGRYYDRDPYERYPTRGGYDNKNYRPWDETYRGTSGFDNSGRGYYFAGTQPNEQPTTSHYRPIPSTSHGRPYSPNSQPPPRPLLPPNSSSSSSTPYAPSSSSGSPSGPPSHHYQYNNRPPRPNDDSKGYAGGWGYVNDRDKPNDYSDRNKDTESESSSYGGRPRPLGGSYLHDRDTNTPMAVSTESGDGKTEEPPVRKPENDTNSSNGNNPN